MAAPLTKWEPSEVAEALKKEYARAKRRRNRWGGKVETPTAVVPAPAPDPAVTLQARVDEINSLLAGPIAPAEKEALLTARNDLVKQLVAAKFGAGSGTVVAGRGPFSTKVFLPNDACPGGALNLVGLIIGPRGKTQQRLQSESGCTVVVRGKGASKNMTNGPQEGDDEPPHVLIRGPSDANVQKVIEMLSSSRRIVSSISAHPGAHHGASPHAGQGSRRDAHRFQQRGGREMAQRRAPHAQGAQWHAEGGQGGRLPAYPIRSAEGDPPR